MDRYWAANFAKFVILACPLSVMGYQMFNSLLLFKYEIKQNVSNTNIVKNKILISFAMVSMVGATIWFFANFAKSAKKHKITNFAKFVILAYPVSVIGYQISKSLLLFKYEIKQNVSNTNIVKNKIGISFTMVSMVGATIGFCKFREIRKKA